MSRFPQLYVEDIVKCAFTQYQKYIREERTVKYNVVYIEKNRYLRSCDLTFTFHFISRNRAHIKNVFLLSCIVILNQFNSYPLHQFKL